MAKSAGTTGKLNVGGNFVDVNKSLEVIKIKPPPQLRGPAIKVWDELINATPFNHFSESDFPILVSYCQNYVLMLELQDIMDECELVVEDDRGKLVPHPAFAMHQSTSGKLATLSSKLRLSPNSRQSIKSTKSKEREKPTSRMGALLG